MAFHTFLLILIAQPIIANTVLTSFLEATQDYGILYGARSDHGGKNVGLLRFMKDVCGHDRGSYIVGRSVHNTDIERLWRDMYTYVPTVA